MADLPSESGVVLRPTRSTRAAGLAFVVFGVFFALCGFAAGDIGAA